MQRFQTPLELSLSDLQRTVHRTRNICSWKLRRQQEITSGYAADRRDGRRLTGKLNCQLKQRKKPFCFSSPASPSQSDPAEKCNRHVCAAFPVNFTLKMSKAEVNESGEPSDS